MLPRLLSLLGLLCAFTAHAADEAAIQRGRDVYMKQQCYACHGTQGQGGERNAGPRIMPNPFPFAAFEIQMRKPRATMPRYTVKDVDAEQLKDLYAFVLSIPASPAVANIPLLRDAMKKP